MINSSSLGSALQWVVRPVVAVIIAALALTLRLVADGIGLSSFVVAGSLFVDQMSAPDELMIRDIGTGYDGQFFYRLSLDPFTQQQSDFGISFDEPGYRQQRIGLPLAAHVLGAITGASTLVWLPVVNLFGIALLTAGAERLLTRAGANRWWAVAVGLSPGVLIAARLNLAEPLAMGLAVAGVAAWRRSPLASSLLLTSAVLTRETTLALAAGVGIAAVMAWWRAHTASRGIPSRETLHLILAAMPLVALVLWQMWLRDNWDAAVATSTARRLGTPVVDVAGSLSEVYLAVEAPAFQQWGWWFLRVGLVLMVLIAVLALPRSSIAPEVKWGLVLSCGLLLVLGTLTTSQQSTRSTVEAVTLGLLVLAATPMALAQRLALYVPALALVAYALTP